MADILRSSGGDTTLDPCSGAENTLVTGARIEARLDEIIELLVELNNNMAKLTGWLPLNRSNIRTGQ